VELLILCLATVGFGHGSFSVGPCGYLDPIRARNQSVLLPLDVQPSGWMAERMVSVKKDAVDIMVWLGETSASYNP
jgi:hypothetical protein